MLKDKPALRRRRRAGGAGTGERGVGERLRAGPAARRLRHRSGLRRQAGARHQHDAARAAGLGMSISSLLNIGSRAMAASYAQLHGHRQQHRQRQHAGLLAADGGPRDLVQPADRLGLLRQRRRRDDRDARAQRLPDPRGGDVGLDRRRRRRAQHASCSSCESVFQTDQAGLGYAAQQAFNSFVDVANNPQDSSARQSALASVGDDGERLQQRVEPDRCAAGRRRRPAAHLGRLDQLADDADRRPQQADRQRRRRAASRRTACSTSATPRSTTCRSWPA